MQLKSFHLHKTSFFTHGTKNDVNEQGYPLYYFNPHKHMNDVCVLKQENVYVTKRYILAVAILLTQLVTPILVPLLVRVFYNKIKARITKRNSASVYYFLGFVTTTSLLLIIAAAANVYSIYSEEGSECLKSGIDDVRSYYITGAVLLLGVNPIITILSLWYNNFRRHGYCCFICCCGCSLVDGFAIVSIFIIVLTSNILLFNLIYIFMGLITAPIETGSLLFLYSTVFFLLTAFFALMFKGCSIIRQNSNGNSNRNEMTEIENSENFGFNILEEVDETQVEDEKGRQCWLYVDLVIAFLCAVTVLIDLLLYLVFYYEMAITIVPYSSSGGFISSFGSLVPAIFTLTVGIMEKRLITFLSSMDNDKKDLDQNRATATEGRERGYGAIQ